MNLEPESGQSMLENLDSKMEDLDLKTKTEENLNPKALAPELENFDLQISQEKTRSDLAKSLIWLLIGSAIGVAAYICISLGVAFFITKDINAALENGRELITLIWTSLVTLTSGALGFYFGSNTERRKP
jgi:hypothetical protein